MYMTMSNNMNVIHTIHNDNNILEVHFTEAMRDGISDERFVDTTTTSINVTATTDHHNYIYAVSS